MTHTRVQTTKKFLMTALGLSLSSVYAAGFESDARNYHQLALVGAGQGVINNTSTAFANNPALLGTMQKSQIAVTAGTHINKTKIKNQYAATGIGSTTPGTAFVGDDASDAIPQDGQYGAFLAIPKVDYLGYENLYFGVATYQNYNWNVNYSDDFTGIALADKQRVRNQVIAANIAFPLGDAKKVWVGGGYNLNYANVSTATNLGTDAGSIALSSDNQQSGYQYGFYFTPSDRLQFGVAFNSRISHDMDGDTKVWVPASAETKDASGNITAPAMSSMVINGSGKTTVSLPSNYAFSMAYQLRDNINVYSSIKRTKWSQTTGIQTKPTLIASELTSQVKAQNSKLTDAQASTKAASIASTFNNSGAVNYDAHFNDASEYSIGASYQYSPQLVLHSGLRYEESIVNEDQVTLLYPSTNAWSLGFGGQYALSPEFKLGLAGQLKRFDKIEILQSNTANTSSYYGQFDRSQFSLMLDASWLF